MKIQLKNFIHSTLISQQHQHFTFLLKEQSQILSLHIYNTTERTIKTSHFLLILNIDPSPRPAPQQGLFHHKQFRYLMMGHRYV